jgi:AraC-like DNA-binding protein
MMEDIFWNEDGPLLFEPRYPRDYSGPVLAGSSVYCFQKEFGTVLIQEFSSPKFSISYWMVRFLRKIVLRQKEARHLSVQFQMKGSMVYERGLRRMHIREAHHHMVWAPGEETLFHFSKGQEYRLFRVHYAPEMVNELLPDFPQAHSDSFLKKSSWIRTDVRETIDHILSAPYRQEMLRFYFENKVRELLFAMLFAKAEQGSFPGVSDNEIDRVRKVDHIILEDLTAHYTIPELAKKVKLGEMRLKMIFKKIIGVGMFERLKQARLKKAARLLIETDLQVKAIYEMVGYESITGFIEAFKTQYGLSPTQYRKKHKPLDE